MNSQLRLHSFFRRKTKIFFFSLHFLLFVNSFSSWSIAIWREGRKNHVMPDRRTMQRMDNGKEKKTRPKRIRMRELKRLNKSLCKTTVLQQVQKEIETNFVCYFSCSLAFCIILETGQNDSGLSCCILFFCKHLFLSSIALFKIRRTKIYGK